MDKKKIIIISLAALILILIISLVVFKKNNDSVKDNDNRETAGLVTENFVPDFLTTAEKSKLGISDDKQIQAVTRDQSGEVTVYKIINNEADIVDPAQIKPISSK